MNILRDKHPSLALSAPLQAYCESFLKRHHLNYFQVLRVNQDGSTVLLTNRGDFTRFSIEYAYKHQLPLTYSCPKKEALDPSSYFFLWEPNLPTRPVQLVKNEFDINHGLTFVERFSTHYYMFAFGAPHDNHGVLDFYMNHIDTLKGFIQNFRSDQADLLQRLEAEPLAVPKALRDENLEAMLLASRMKERIPVSFQGTQSYLTPMEYNCLSMLPKGHSAKQIGKILGISNRTVEAYLQRVKARVGCTSKHELIQLLD